MFHNPIDSEIYIGSSNISRGALTSYIEWNYRFLKSNAPNEKFYEFQDKLEALIMKSINWLFKVLLNEGFS
ncbi:hypothetical protein [Clostridium hominis]|uniref:hypothetical protein n=1 Tax=Clostridium hominis TaxID=2763036 RepID=UPI003F50AA58